MSQRELHRVHVVRLTMAAREIVGRGERFLQLHAVVLDNEDFTTPVRFIRST